MAFLCIDIGGTNTLLGLGNGSFEIEKKTSSKEFLDDIATEIEEVVRNSKHSIEEVNRVTVAAAGPLDREEGVFYPPNIDKKSVQLKKPLQELGELEIINDCTAAVMGEYHYGDSADNMIYVTISSGIGMGVILNGRVVEGWNGNLGEIGHMQTEDHGLECGCGDTDHWEAYCSGNNLPKMAEEIFNQEFKDAREIFDSYDNGDSSAEKVIEKMNEINLEAFSNMVNLFNPELIAIGGAVALNHSDTVIGPLKEQLDESTINNTPEIKRCSLGDKAVLHGLRAVCNQDKNTGEKGNTWETSQSTCCSELR